MRSFFDADGMFRLDELTLENTTFQKIMEDGVVTDAEIVEQSERVITLFRRLEGQFAPEQLTLIADAVTQLGVLHSVVQYKQLQEFHH